MYPIYKCLQLLKAKMMKYFVLTILVSNLYIKNMTTYDLLANVASLMNMNCSLKGELYSQRNIFGIINNN